MIGTDIFTIIGLVPKGLHDYIVCFYHGEKMGGFNCEVSLIRKTFYQSSHPKKRIFTLFSRKGGGRSRGFPSFFLNFPNQKGGIFREFSLDFPFIVPSCSLTCPLMFPSLSLHCPLMLPLMFPFIVP